MDAASQHRWMGVGSSQEVDAQTAGAAATEQALVESDAKLLVVFASSRLDPEQLLKAIRSSAPGVPVIGCTTAGEIGGDRAGDDSVVITAFGGPGFEVTTSVAKQASTDLHRAGEIVASAAAAPTDRHQVLILLSDGLAGDQQEIVRGAYATLGAGVPLVGGCAGDDMKMTITHQFHDDEVLTDSVVAAGLRSQAPIGIGVRHGWRAVGDRMLITQASDNRVHRIDDQPALDVYLERAGAPAAAHTDPDAFIEFCMTHPLGLERRHGTEVRAINAADFETRSLSVIAQVPQGEMAWVMEGDDASVLDATDGACSDAMVALGDNQPIGMIAFDCVARRGVLGDAGIGAEIARIREGHPGVPLAGFYTYGEFARTRGSRGFHNQTLVVLAVS